MGEPGINNDTHQNAEKQNSFENNSSKSFFIQLKSFCLSLQNQYQNVTQQFEIPPGSNPRNYDRGLKAIKSEVADVKKFAEDTREKINKVQQFSYFVESTKELINAQMEDVQRMEKYLMRYGYIPPEEVEINEDSTEDKKPSVEENVDKFLKSPELSEIGRKVIEGNALPILTNLTKPTINEPLIVNQEKIMTTPLHEINSKWYMTPSPDVSSRRKVEKWIECVEAASGSITPVCKSVKNALSFENEDSSCDSQKYTHYDMNLVNTCVSNDVATTTPKNLIIPRKDSSFVKKPNHFQDTTPEEPILHSQSQNRQNIFQDSTPEEPILLSQSKNPQNIFQSTTPKEPILLSQSKNQQNIQDATPEEPLILSQTKYHKGRERMNSNSHSAFSESVSPQLSDITLKVLNLRHMDPHKSDTITNVKSHNFSKLDNTVQDMEPESPKLSDVTLKVLQKHSRIF